MIAHAVGTYPSECCGAMLGRHEAGGKSVCRAIALQNVHTGPHSTRYAVRPEDLIEVEKSARRDGLALIGIYHSHPDHDAYFSEEDLRNSCPWYSFVVLSIRGGRFHHARSWLPDTDQSKAEPEVLSVPEAGAAPSQRCIEGGSTPAGDQPAADLPHSGLETDSPGRPPRPRASRGGSRGS